MKVIFYIPSEDRQFEVKFVTKISIVKKGTRLFYGKINSDDIFENTKYKLLWIEDE